MGGGVLIEEETFGGKGAGTVFTMATVGEDSPTTKK